MVNNENRNFMDTEFYRQNFHKEITGEQINNATNNETFYKYVSENLNHHNFIHKIGLNENSIKFD